LKVLEPGKPSVLTAIEVLLEIQNVWLRQKRTDKIKSRGEMREKASTWVQISVLHDPPEVQIS
jgi:hypothetical protein